MSGFTDFEKIPDLTERRLSRTTVYRGKVLDVVSDDVMLPNGHTSVREMCLHKGAVAVIPVTSDGKVVMEYQYRYAHGRVFFEIPAGKLDYAGEDRLEAAKRELKEETGATAGKYTYLGELDTTPALINEKIYMYLAEDLDFGDRRMDDDEFINVVFTPLETLYRMVMNGEIKDSKTQVAVLKVYELYRENKQHRAGKVL